MMSRPKPIPCAPLVFLVILFTTFKLSHTIQCPQTEKLVLLSFKQSLEDPFGLLSSWNNGSEVNCCNWKGVVCNNFTGHVQQLHLHNNNNYYYPFIIPRFLSGKISHSVLNLTQLRYLDLSGNNFTGTIPSFIGSLRSLRYLNLSNAGFHGAVPHSIGNLSNLRTLALGTEEYENSLYTNSLEWLSGLSKLKHLSMNQVNLSKAAANWAPVINSLPSLVQVRLNYCNLRFITDSLMNEVNVSSTLSVLDLSGNYDDFPSGVPRWIFQLNNLVYLDLSDKCIEGSIPSISNTTKLQHIDLSGNSFNSTIPDWLYSCTDLQFVDLSENFLQGTISNAIANLSSLNTLYLSFNELSGKIPREIASLCEMQNLVLSDNKLQGELSDSFGNMSDCFLDSLQFLNLYRNQLFGHITDEFGEFKSLTYLSLDSNLLSGAIPSSLGQLMSLEDLYLSDNQLSGNLPESLGQLFNLKYLSIRDNLLSGNLPESLGQLFNLKYLSIRDNLLSGNLPESLGQLFNLEYLLIGDNKLEGVLTECHFANLTKLTYLDASNNNKLTLKVNPNWIPPFQITVLRLGSWDLGTNSIPSWIKKQKNLDELDVSSTGISGIVPSWIWGIRYLNLSHNHLNGKLPDIFGNSSAVYLSSNKFSGPLPRVGDSVFELDLSNNSFSGGLSHFLCDISPNLLFLHLEGNQLTGEFQACFMNLTYLKVLNLGNNNLSGSIPNSIGFLKSLMFLNLYRNNFSGQIPFSMRNCTNLRKIDLHENNLDGNIPTWIGMSLTQLVVLILRSNKLSGEMSSDLCHLNSVRILDLSNNKIFGIIPSCVNNFTAMITKRDPTELYFDCIPLYFRTIPTFIFESATLSTKGQEHPYDTILRFFTIINLANNNLSGDIPKEMTSLVELRSLNLSGNHFTGLIPNSIGDMKQLESLDLSRNSLSGGIPDSLASINSLAYLNLSYNNLTGKIPQGPQILGFELLSFMGNHLCGPQVKKICKDDGDQVPEPGHNANNEGEKSEIDWFYVFLSSGFATGFAVACSTLILNKSWRDAYFGFVEDMGAKLYVFFYVKWRMLLRR